MELVHHGDFLPSFRRINMKRRTLSLLLLCLIFILQTTHTQALTFPERRLSDAIKVGEYMTERMTLYSPFDNTTTVFVINRTVIEVVDKVRCTVQEVSLNDTGVTTQTFNVTEPFIGVIFAENLNVGDPIGYVTMTMNMNGTEVKVPISPLYNITETVEMVILGETRVVNMFTSGEEIYRELVFDRKTGILIRGKFTLLGAVIQSELIATDIFAEEPTNLIEEIIEAVKGIPSSLQIGLIGVSVVFLLVFITQKKRIKF